MWALLWCLGGCGSTPSEPNPPPEPVPDPAPAAPPAPAPAGSDDVEVLRARLAAPDAPEKVCATDTDCTLVRLTCCAPAEAVHTDHRSTFDLATDNPMCQRVRCRQPPERVARCVSARCEALPP
jgi:hypothetical protein